MSGPTWTDIRPGLVELFGALALRDEESLQPGCWKPEWRDEPVTATAVTGQLKGVKLYLKITSCVMIGSDEIRWEQAEATPQNPYPVLQETVYGLRRVTLRVEAQCNQVNDNQWALSILERINTRLSRTRSYNALIALNVGIIDIGAATDISAKKDQHVQSRAFMDLKLTIVSTDRDPIPTGWVQSVEITGTIADADFTVVDGETVPVPLTIVTQVTTP
jgi:hypothetical protein